MVRLLCRQMLLELLYTVQGAVKAFGGDGTTKMSSFDRRGLKRNPGPFGVIDAKNRRIFTRLYVFVEDCCDRMSVINPA